MPNKSVSHTTIGRWKKRAVELEDLSQKAAPDAKRVRTSGDPALYSFMKQWLLSELLNRKIVLSYSLIRKVAKVFYFRNDVPIDKQLSITNDWISGILEDCKMSHRVFHGEGDSVTLEKRREGRRDLKKLFRKALVEWQYKPHQIWNFDESGLYHGSVPNKGICKRARAGVKEDKQRFTLGFACSLTGEKRPPMVISNAWKHRCFGGNRSGRDLGYDYYVSRNAWVNKKLFEEYLTRWDNELKRKGDERVLLFIDNFSGHMIDEKRLERLKLEFLPPNLTAFVQPLDAGIIQCFKAIYKRLFLERNIDKIYELNIEADFYKITRKEALELIMQAWNSVTAETIVNCWKKVRWAYRAFDPRAITANEDTAMDYFVDEEDLSEVEANPESQKENTRPDCISNSEAKASEIIVVAPSISQVSEVQKEVGKLQEVLDSAQQKAEQKKLRFEFLNAKEFLELDEILFEMDLPSVEELTERIIEVYKESQVNLAAEEAILLDRLQIDLKILDDLKGLIARYKAKPPKGLAAYLKSVTKEIGRLRAQLAKT